MRKIMTLLLSAAFLLGAASFADALEDSVIVVSYAGEVRITPAGTVKAIDCKPEMLLGAGDRIKTGPESYAEIAFERAKNNIVRIEGRSDVILKLDGPDKLELINGEIFAMLNDLKRGEEFRIKTPAAVCGARGTGWNTTTDSKVTNVAVFDGRVSVRGVNPDGTVMEKKFWVKKGFERRVKRFSRPEKMRKIPKEKFRRIKKKGESLRRKPAKGRVEKKERKTLIRKKMEKKSAESSRAAKVRDERRASILDRKDEKKLDEIREDKTNVTSDSGSRVSP